MRINPMAPGQNAGMTCYYDENTFLKFGIFMEPLAQDDDKSPSYVMKINVIQHIDEEDIACDGVEIDTKQRYIYFKIVTNYLKRSFYYSYDGENYIPYSRNVASYLYNFTHSTDRRDRKTAVTAQETAFPGA